MALDQGTLIRKEASRAWDGYAAARGVVRTELRDGSTLRTLLEELAEMVYGLTVVEDDSLTDLNIEGELNREDGLILLRPNLPNDRANFVIGHEIGHRALNHPLQRVTDTAREINTEATPDDLSADRQQNLTGLDLSSEAGLTALRGYSDRDVYELQANAFATELLVPGEDLRTAFAAHPDLPTAKLAARLGVPISLLHVGMVSTLLRPAAREKQRASIGISTPATETNPERADGNTSLDNTPLTLDDRQNEAVFCAPPALIVAGPGAGKTRVLTHRYARLVREGLSPRHILALTFSNKAAGEMRERIAAEVSPEAGELEIYTFHAFGLQLLQQYGTRIGLKLPLRLLTRMDALLLFRRRAAKMAMESLNNVHTSMKALSNLLSAVSRAKEENAGPERWQELVELWQEANPGQAVPAPLRDGQTFYREYQNLLKRNGLVDYGDLQTEALHLFETPEIADEIRQRYQVVLVDEFQDINYVSGRLVRALDGGRGVVWVVGDPRQQIYGFRGASPVNLSRFRTEEYYPNAQVVTLTTNYRSVPDIVTTGTNVEIPLPEDRSLYPPALNAHRSAENIPAVTVASCPHGDDEMHWLASEIERLNGEGIPLSDVAVLTRKKDHGAAVAAALTERRIAHQWGGPLEKRAVFRVLYSALLLAADDTTGIVGLTILSPGEGIAPDVVLSESDRRALLSGRARWKAQDLLKYAVQGKISELSAEGVTACKTLLEWRESLNSDWRPHRNLCVYLFELARWIREWFPAEAQERHAVRAGLATVGQVMDLAASFAGQREALSRVRATPDASSNLTSGDVSDAEMDETTAGATDGSEPALEDLLLETETTTESFVSYMQSALSTGDLGVPYELECGGDAVSVLTAHRSKGLEWPVVFVPYCVDGQFPMRFKKEEQVLPPGLIATDESDETVAHARDEACLFYVAATRAKDRLYLSYSDRYKKAVKGGVSALLTTLLVGLAAANVPVNRVEITQPIPATADTAPGVSTIVIPDTPYDIPNPIYLNALDNYAKCPRQFLFSEVYGLADGDRAYLRFHRAVYKVIEEFADDPDVLIREFDKRWAQDGPDDDHWQTPLLRQNAERIIAQTVEEGRRRAKVGGGRSYRQEKVFDLGTLTDGTPARLKFKVDEEVTEADGSRTWRKHKGSPRPPKNTPDEPIATLYALQAEQEGVSVEVVYHYPQASVDMKPTIGPKKKQNFIENRLQMLSDLHAGKMAPSPDDNECSRCPYAFLCDHGSP